MKKLIFLFVAIAALALPFLACGSTAGGSTGTAVTATSAPAGTTPTAAAKTWKVGDTVKLGDWTIIANKASTSTGGEFAKPKSGNIYLVVNVTVTNGGSAAQAISSIGSFKLADSTGQTYTETIVDGLKNPPDGNVAAGGKLSGDLAYEVPKTEKSFTLAFQPDITSTDQVTITITVK